MKDFIDKLQPQCFLLDDCRTKENFLDLFPNYDVLKDMAEDGCSYSESLLKSLYPKDLCSIVIPVHNKISLTQECLDRIRRTCSNMNVEIIIVDNGSTDETVSTFSSNLLYIRLEQNCGIPKALNLGAKKASGSFITFMHNDFMVLKDGWLRDTVCKLKLVPRAGLAGFGASRHVVTSGPLKNRTVYCIDGMNMTLPKPIFDELGGFDENFDFIGYYDIDLSYKIALHDYRPLVCWSPCKHINHGTSGDSNWTEMVERSRKIFFKKWGLENISRNFCIHCQKQLPCKEKLSDAYLICKMCYQKLTLNSKGLSARV